MRMLNNTKTKWPPAIKKAATAILCMVLTACCISAAAQSEGGVEELPAISAIGPASVGGIIPIANGATVSIDKSTLNAQETNKKIVNIVRLSLIEETNNYLPAGFTVSVPVKIEYGNSPTSTLYEYNQTLTVTYDIAGGSKYNAKNYFSFNGAAYVRITITGPPSIPTVGSISTADILLLENEMRVTRYYNLAPGVAPSYSSAGSVFNPVDNLPVTWTWPSNTGHTATELEWTWLEDELEPYYHVNGTLNYNLLFSCNATRIELPYNKNSFNIPLFYDGQGKLFYRLRAVNIKEDGSRYTGDWTTTFAAGNGYCAYGGHNNALNWQVRTSFAEEGKLKSVVEYYDGSLRSRQTVTKENVNNTVVTAESFYDYEGRPVIQILPTPGMGNIIQYQANLNLFNGQASSQQNPAAFFDLSDKIATGADLYKTIALSTATGTSRYYSPNNDELNTGPNKNIPDAEGFPYTVTRYTPDATGRILAQSGVGPAHKMGSGRETKYYYGTPSQEELDGLFGTEVGEYSHYFKNMVRDANGQMSVSYSDMHGRTIATALAGESPDNLLALNINDPAHYPGQAGSSFTRNLLSSNTNVVKNNAIEAINTLLVAAAPTNYTFKYDLAPDKLELARCTPAVPVPLCYDCLYDLEISITDESGDTPPLSWKFSNISITPDDTCTTGTPLFTQVSGSPATITGSNIEFTHQFLEVGSYSVRKTLTLSEASLEYYKQQYLTIGKGICKTEQQLIDSVYSVLYQTSDCNIPASAPCDSCRAQLGTPQEFQTAYLLSLGNPPLTPTLQAQILAAYTEANENCNSICNETSQLTGSKRDMMLADMMPYGGQYATDIPVPPLVQGSGTSMYNKYNIFQTTFNPSIQPYYKKPKAANGSYDFYRDALGNIDPQIHPDGTLTNLSGLAPNDFTNQFVNEWANALLPYHPEYARLKYVEGTLEPANVYNWIHTFNNTNTYAAAQTAGYIMTGIGNINDPFYTVPSLPTSYKTDMASWINNSYAGSNYSLWQMARAQVRCQNDPNQQACIANSLTPGGAPTKIPPFQDITTTTDKDKMWEAFRGLYAAARDNQVNTWIATHVPVSDETALKNQGYQLRFTTNAITAAQYGWTWFPPNPGNPPPIIPSDTTGITYQSQCESYITQWRTQLLQCTALADLDTTTRNQILNEITTGMVSVCVRGSDAANDHGSSTVAPSQVSATLPNSFEQVITSVFTTHGINQRNTYFCNPYVIEFPKPYGKNPKFAQEYTSVIDSCACAHFDSLKVRATAASYNPNVLSSINDYLQVNNMDTLTPALHTALLNCSSYKVEVCDTIQVSKTVSCYDPSPCDDVCQLRQGNQSESNAIESVPADCTQWNFLISCFYELSEGLPNSNPASCQIDFAAHFNSFYSGNNFSWAQVDSTYKADCNPAGLNVCVSCSTTVLCSQPTNCRYVFAPHFLSSPEPLPDYLICGGWPPQSKCLSCDSLVSLTSQFKLKFNPPYNAGPVFTGTNLTGEQLDQNNSYARFLNFRTGYQYSWMEYAQAAAASNCDPLGGGGSSIVDLVVTNRTGNTPAQYIASNSITFDPNFESTLGDEFETLLQPNGGGGGSQTVICRNNRPLNDTTGIFVIDSACHRTRIMSITLGQTIYQQQLIAIQANFERQYREKCMAAKNSETFTVTYTNKEYHYTLYYYDMAGSLVKTVPPKGVRPDFSTAFTNSVKAAREADGYIPRPHEYVTQYRYNSLGQVITQNSPDANTSKFWYDRLGRLVVSQNAQQAITPLPGGGGGGSMYSYTLYDELGRITEVGQKPQTTLMTQTISQDDAALNDWIITNGNTREQLTQTVYDVPYHFDPPNPSGLYPMLDQQNLRNRVSFTATKNLATDLMQYAATFYTYDIHGNVDTLLQDYKGVAEMNGTSNRFKMMTYKYDLISGKVNMVSYQPDWFNTETNQWVINPDKFFHKYKYDAENRLTEAWTSRDKIEWERDAAYNYYKHGPLSRTVLGQQQVQGVDYAYTTHGWLKGVNGTTLGDGLADMGGDGLIGGINSKVARDIYGFALHYFDDGNTNTSQAKMDFKPIGVQIPIAGGGGAAFARPNNNAFVSLYNGNIGAMSVNNAGLLKGAAASTNALPLFYNYRYDQLNRIKSMNTFSGLSNTNTWAPVPINDYAEAISYDPNGNILTYNRKGSPSVSGKPLEMDNLTYNYYTDKNQLQRVDDNVPAVNYTEDIDGQTNFNNYTYDEIGNLKKDLAEGITNINWTVYGKISSITKVKNGETTTINYTYDASGNRITKTVIPPAGGGGAVTIYIRDASGNVMSIYEKPTAGAIEQTENHLYGSSRIGIVNKLTVPVSTITLSGIYGTAYLSTFTRGEKNYEMSNHLGNVLVTVSDRKLQISAGGITVDYYTADVVSATDNYVFGMTMPGRNYQSDKYRYGFNGKEKDKDISEGDLDFGERIYDGRIARFLSIDKYTNKLPYYSPYLYAGNKPILCIDKDGNIEVIVTLYQRGIDGTIVKVGECTTTIKTIEDAKGIERDAYRINVLYEINETSRQINPQTVESTYEYKLISVLADGNTGLDSDEQDKRDHPVDHFFNKLFKGVANSIGVGGLAKGQKDHLYGYGREDNGEYITEDRAKMYTIDGFVKLGTFGLSGATGKLSTWALWELADAGVEILSSELEKMNLGSDKGYNLIYSTLKLGLSLVSAKDPSKLTTALELASELADMGIKGEALINELNKRGVNMNEEIVKDKKAAANSALSKFKKYYSSDEKPAKID
jgi:RHS repeat-associated protein